MASSNKRSGADLRVPTIHLIRDHVGRIRNENWPDGHPNLRFRACLGRAVMDNIPVTLLNHFS